MKATVLAAIRSSRSGADGESPMRGHLPALGASIQSPDDDEGPPQDEQVMVVLGRSMLTFAEGSGQGSFS